MEETPKGYFAVKAECRGSERMIRGSPLNGSRSMCVCAAEHVYISCCAKHVYI